MADPFGYIATQSLSALTRGSRLHWGDPIKNREMLIPYGFGPIDKALYGIDADRGEFIVLQGKEKGRKSTVMQNIVKNIMEWPNLKNKPTIVIDVLESSSGPTVVKDNFVCMVASDYLMMQGHRSDNGSCKACGGGRCKQLTLSSRGLRFMTRSKSQREAINYALKEIDTWPVYVFGPGVDEGQTRDLEKSMKRWAWLMENVGATFFISDHVQQYYSEDRKGISDYEKQQIVVPVMSTFVGNYKPVVMALSQLSLATRKDKEGRQYATGGAQMAAEANTVIQTDYDEDHQTVIAAEIIESRYSGKLKVYGRIDPTSGVMYGDMGYDHPVINERPMTNEEKEVSPYG